MDPTSLSASQPTQDDSAKPLIESLRGPADFDPVFQLGLKAAHGSATLRLLRRPDQQGTRIGLIVPKKKTKLAVMRNAFKRVAKEALRHAVQRGDDLAGCDVVIQFNGLPERDLDAFKARARAEVDRALAKALAAAPAAPSPAQAPARRPSMR